MQTRVKTRSEITAMREAGRMLAHVLRVTAASVCDGISTKELANVAAAELKTLGGKPSFLGYQGFPDVMCISVNEQIVHGIPSRQKILHDGDLVSLDFGVTCNRMITDGAISLAVGRLKQGSQEHLLAVTEESLAAGVAAAHGGVRVGDISSAIESYIRAAGAFGIPRDLVGHGVGNQLWEEPNIPNYGRANTGPWLDSGMTVAIEPMVSLGTDQIQLADDGWTISTSDGSRAAHFEHTVLITEDGAEILTI